MGRSTQGDQRCVLADPVRAALARRGDDLAAVDDYDVFVMDPVTGGKAKLLGDAGTTYHNVSKLLGMSKSDLRTALKGGASMSSLADQKGAVRIRDRDDSRARRPFPRDTARPRC